MSDHQTSGLTKKQLTEAAGIKPYIVNYYREIGILPLVKKSRGRGYPTVYHPASVDVVRERMARRRGEMIEGSLSRK